MSQVVPPERYAELLEAGLALAAELSLPAVLQRIVELAAEITSARYGALGVLGPDGFIHDFITTGVSEHQRRAIGAPPVGRGILGVLIRDARPLRLADLTKDPRSVGFPPHHPTMRSFLGVPVVARGLVYGNLYLTEKQGAAEFTAEDERMLQILAAQAGIAIDNARLYEEARRRAQRLEALREVTTAIIEGAGLQEALELVARRALELADADLTSVALPGDRPGELALQISSGRHADSLRGVHIPVERSVSGEVLRTGKTIAVPDVATDTRVAHPALREQGFGPALFVPLRAHSRTFGTLIVARLAGAPRFADADVELVEAFADQAAVAVEHARFREQLSRLAILEDRERIARELHDGAIQALFAVGMGLQGTALLVEDPAVAERIEKAVAELDRVISDLRGYIFQLRPGLLADRQLAEALRQLASELEQRAGVTCVADIDEQLAGRLDYRAGDLVQLAREALSNVGRHAQATTCRLSLRREEGEAVLEVDDDGRGFDTGHTYPGQGLRNLRERAERLGGSLELASSPGEGTTVRVRLPL